MRDSTPLYGDSLLSARAKAEQDLLKAEDEIREAWGALSVARLRVRMAAGAVIAAAIHCGDLARRAALEGD